MLSVGPRVRSWWSPIAAILLVGLVGWWSNQPPERFSAAKTVDLDATAATHDRGHAYWLSLRWIAPGLTSDKEGVSQITFLENGTALTGRALHDDIRNSGAGLYSHWGSAILFSTRDGSDPRINGFRYQVHLPPIIPLWHRGAQIALLASALLLMLRWLHQRAGDSLVKTGLWAIGGTLAIAGLVVGTALSSSPARELQAFRQTIHRDPIPAATPGSTPASRPRTRHLLSGGPIPAFVSEAPPHTAPRPRAITLSPTQGTERADGFVELGGDSILHSAEPLRVPASDLESVVLELEAARGDSLILHLASCDGISEAMMTIDISFAIETTPGLQTYRFRRPALGGMDCVGSVAIRAAPDSKRPPIVRIGSLRYGLRLDAFTEQPTGLDPVDLEGSLRPALWQSVVGHFLLPLRSDDGTLLKLAVGALTDTATEPIEATIFAVAQDGGRSVLHRGLVDPLADWKELTLTVPEGSHTLLLEGTQLPERSVLLWSGARLIDLERPPQRLILILADTLRADALGCYGHPGDPTPTLDALARQGARFERAFSQTYWTRPSMASIMTGRYVAATGVQTIDQRLPESYETLPERLTAGGFTTVGIITNPNAGPLAGLGQGFERIYLSNHEQTAPLITDAVLPALDTLEDDDVFLYLHLMEPHGPYGPLEPTDDLRLPKGGTPLPYDRAFDRHWHTRPTGESRRALYAYDVSSMDRALGELIRHLDERWRSSDGPPILAFVSDHGEHLGERGQWGHKWADLYPENVQVPMIIRAPGCIPPQTAVSNPVEIRHLGATLLDLVGLAPRSTDPESAAWWSLLPLLGAEDKPAPAFALSAAEEDELGAFSLFGQRYSYVARIVGRRSRIATYSDPGFDRRVRSHWLRPVLENRFLNVRRTYLESQGKIRERQWEGVEESTRVIDPQALEDLKALGYLQD